MATRQSSNASHPIPLQRQSVTLGHSAHLWRWSLRGLAFLTVLGGVATTSARADLASRTLLLDAALAGKAVVTVGERGTILRSTDNARTWTEIPSHASATLTAVTFADDKVGWAVGHDALLLATHDGGTSWTRQWQGENLTDSLLDVLALDATHAIAVGAYGFYISTEDGGKTWTRRKLLENDYHLNRISRGPSGTLYLAGEHGTLLRSGDAGATWTSIPTSYDGSFYGVLPLGPETLLAYGLRGRVFRSDTDGRNWTPVATDDTALVATGVTLRSGLIVFAGQLRLLLVGAAAGQSLTRCDAGVSTGIAELLELPDGDLLAVGEAGVAVIPAARISAGVTPAPAAATLP